MKNFALSSPVSLQACSGHASCCQSDGSAVPMLHGLSGAVEQQGGASSNKGGACRDVSQLQTDLTQVKARATQQEHQARAALEAAKKQDREAGQVCSLFWPYQVRL